MRYEEKKLTSIVGYKLVGIYADQLSVDDRLLLFANEFILKFRNMKTEKIVYWRIAWVEDVLGSDHLIIHVQETPTPLKWMHEPALSNEEFILSSQYTTTDCIVTKITGHGYKEGDEEIFTSLLIELEESYILINTGAIISIRHIKEKPLTKPWSDYIMSGPKAKHTLF